MKICFVDPKGRYYGFNTGIAYIVSYLNEHMGDRGIKVFDFNNDNRNVDERINELSSYDLIGFSIKSFTIDYALKIASAVKRKGNILVAGGPHITLDGVNFLKENPCFDYAIFGEGEVTFEKLVNALNNNEPIESIKGIAYRKEGAIAFTGNSDRITALDVLPFPNYAAFDSVRDGIANYPLMTSRGCPYQCTYCCVGRVMGKTWYARSVDNILTELKMVISKYRSKQFHIQDDNFTFDIIRAKKFCDGLMKDDIDLKWSCSNGLRADKIDAELMQKMKKSGCFMINLGIESGNRKEFEAIKKGERLSDIVNTIKLAHKNKLLVLGNFIIGLPHSDLKSIAKSVEYAKKLRLESCIFNLLVPFPGTEMWHWINRNGRFLIDWRKGFAQGKKVHVVFETDNFNEKERLLAYYKANIKCKNYFAFMDEKEGPMHNIVNVAKAIIKYDLLSIHKHVFYWLKHIKRIATRIIYTRNKHV